MSSSPPGPSGPTPTRPRSRPDTPGPSGPAPTATPTPTATGPKTIRHPKLGTITRAHCEEWAKNPEINPKTGRVIDPTATNGAFAAFEEACKRFGIEPIVSNVPYRIGNMAVPRNDSSWEELITDAEDVLTRIEGFSFIDIDEYRWLTTVAKVLAYAPGHLERSASKVKQQIGELANRDVRDIPDDVDINELIERTLEKITGFIRGDTYMFPRQELMSLEHRLNMYAYYHGRDDPAFERAQNIIPDLQLLAEELEARPEDSNGNVLPSSRSVEEPGSLSKSTDRPRKYGSSYRRHEALSRGRSVPLGVALSPLPAASRQQLLQELVHDCREMRDTITYERFDRMPKRQLQLVVRLGPSETGSGKPQKQQCYYVRSIYDHWYQSEKDNRPLRDPATRRPLTDADKAAIMRLIRYIDPDAPDLRRKRAAKEATLQLRFRNVIYESEEQLRIPFYQIMVVKKLPYSEHAVFNLGYIPADLEPSDFGSIRAQDVSSAVLVQQLNELFEKGRLLSSNRPPYRCCRIHLSKPISYWLDPENPKGIAVGKVVHMLNEVRSML